MEEGGVVGGRGELVGAGEGEGELRNSKVKLRWRYERTLHTPVLNDVDVRKMLMWDGEMKTCPAQLLTVLEVTCSLELVMMLVDLLFLFLRRPFSCVAGLGDKTSLELGKFRAILALE